MSHLSLPLILFALVLGGTAYSQSDPYDQQQSAAPPGPGGRMPMFQSMDTDKDGAVSREEFMAGHQTRQQGYFAADTDKDGTISREEFMQSGQQRRDERFSQLDRDGDGRLSQAELSARATAMFSAMDANQDGKLTQDEMGRPRRGPRP